jgi:ABC-2 type transport system permease protein
MLSESYILFKRNLLLSIRSLDALFAGILTPALLMILFVYVFGGAMDVGDISYVDFVVPGVLVQCIAQSSSSVGVVVNQDLKGGVAERLLTLNISKSAFLNGHVLAATLRSFVSTLVVLLVAVIIGFRPQGSFLAWCAALTLILLFTLAFTWLSVVIGILAKSPETATAFTVLITLLPYLSSGFVPTDTMPKALAFFAKHQPMSPIINALRGLMMAETTPPFVAALTWCIALIVLSWLAARFIYQWRIQH